MQFQINDFSYDRTNGLIVKGQEEFQLTKTQKKLFNYFLEHPNTTISKQTLMDEVWGRTITENSVEKTLSKLRNIIEDNPLKPEILITHFGHGISFEGEVKQPSPEKKNEKIEKDSLAEKQNKNGLLLLVVVVLGLALLVWKFFPDNKRDVSVNNQVHSLKKNQKLIILPMTFDEISRKSDVKKGFFEYLKVFFTHLDTEGQVLFDENSQNSKEAMEKLWQIDQDLVMMQTDVSKNGEVYDAVIEFSKGMNAIKTVKISAPSLNKLAQAQINVVSQFHAGDEGDINTHESAAINTEYLLALALVKNKDYQKAKQIVTTLLKQDDNNHQARFLLSRIFFYKKEYEKSLTQLITLKQTSFYSDHSAEIELKIADVSFAQSNEKNIIVQLTEYLSQSVSIGTVKKAKIMLKLAFAHMKVGNNSDALKFFKQSVLKINEKLHPALFADSMRGQAYIKALNSVDNEVYALYDKALEYSKQGGDMAQQAKILDGMSIVLLHNNNWEKGLKLKKDSLALTELSGDKRALASGLAVLADYMLNRGLFDECREVLNRLKIIADELNDDNLRLTYNHYNISLEMNYFRHDYCQTEIDRQFKLARETHSLSYELNATFLQMELLLARKETLGFLDQWQKHNEIFEKPGLARYQIYMDNYLARYYNEVSDSQKAIDVIAKVSERAKATNDFRFLVYAQSTLAQVYMKSDPQKALDILLNLEQYDPNPNPHLELKAIALNLVGKKVEALAVLTEAKKVFNQAWKAENQALLEQLQHELIQ